MSKPSLAEVNGYLASSVVVHSCTCIYMSFSMHMCNILQVLLSAEHYHLFITLVTKNALHYLLYIHVYLDMLYTNVLKIYIFCMSV